MDVPTPFNGQLLATKFFVPTSSHPLIPRPHLIDLLNEGLRRKLTLISAPAGFGKTTLVSAWLQSFPQDADRKSTRLNSSHQIISYAVFCLKKKKQNIIDRPP